MMQRREPKILIPYFEGGVSAGVPSAAYDECEQPLDLNELLIKNPISTFFVRVEGDSMQGAGIQSGDLLIVDRSLPIEDGKVVVAVLQGEFTVKRLKKMASASIFFLIAHSTVLLR